MPGTRPRIAARLSDRATVVEVKDRLYLRLDAEGRAVPLPEQDRARWRTVDIEVGTGLVTRALSLGRPGPLQLEAAIAAVHCNAATADARNTPMRWSAAKTSSSRKIMDSWR